MREEGIKRRKYQEREHIEKGKISRERDLRFERGRHLRGDVEILKGEKFVKPNVILINLEYGQ